MKSLTLSSKNQVVIPKAVRGKLNLSSGDTLLVHELSDDYVILKKQPSFHDLRGIIKPDPVDAVERVRQVREPWRAAS